MYLEHEKDSQRMAMLSAAEQLATKSTDHLLEFVDATEAHPKPNTLQLRQRRQLTRITNLERDLAHELRAYASTLAEIERREL